MRVSEINHCGKSPEKSKHKVFTAYPPVNQLLGCLLKKVTDILSDEFVGMYIQGSLALEDFVPDRSDIDLVVVTQFPIRDDLLKKLESMHKKITDGKMRYAKRFECIYIPIDALRHHSQRKAYFPCLHVGGEFYTDGFGIIEKHILREKGMALKGPNPKSFVRSVSLDELKKAALNSLQNWWLPQLKGNSRLKKDDYQVYAILTMCRAIYTIDKGDVVSKSRAASYAQGVLDKRWAPLIDKALSWKIGNKFNHLEETLNFIRYALLWTK
ncbi:DUF4111 domain-containing protein [Candidatus Shapirobacteria bacterium]|nr:DUF4111 domain-containing protein [Candidatus Shapirobacteria bacterium]